MVKTINDLEFKKHLTGTGVQATIFFDNGYGASVVQGSMFYSDGHSTYEVAILKGDSIDWTICYNTDITDDVIGHLSKPEVTDILRQIQNLDKA